MATVPCVVDSCSLDLEINEENKLTGAVNINPAGGIECTPGQGIGVNVGDSGCGIDLAINGANELVGNLDFRNNPGLLCDAGGVGVLRDPNACNALTLGAAGLRVNEHGSRLLTDGTALGAGCGIGQFLGIDLDIGCLAANSPNFVPISQTAALNFTNPFCRTVNVQFIIGQGPARYAVSNGWTLAIGANYTVTSPNINGGVPFASSIGFTELNAQDSPLAANRSLRATYPSFVGSDQTFLFPGQSISLSAFATAAATDVGPGAAAGALFFGVTVALNIWTRD